MKTITKILAAATLIAAPVVSQAAVIVSTVGVGEPAGSTTLANTWTGGIFALANQDHGWTHNYGAIADGILSVTLQVDIIDAQNGTLNIHAGNDATGTLLGSAGGFEQGTPGIWRAVGPAAGPDPSGTDTNVGSAVTVLNLTLTPALLADIADGTFALFGDAVVGGNNMGRWGGNEAILTITTDDIIVPTNEPATLGMMLMSVFGLVALRRRQQA